MRKPYIKNKSELITRSPVGREWPCPLCLSDPCWRISVRVGEGRRVAYGAGMAAIQRAEHGREQAGRKLNITVTL